MTSCGCSDMIYWRASNSNCNFFKAILYTHIYLVNAPIYYRVREQLNEINIRHRNNNNDFLFHSLFIYLNKFYNHPF